MNDFIVSEKYSKERIDIILSESLNNLTRSNLKNRLLSVSLNGKECKISSKAGVGDIIKYELLPETETVFRAEKIELDILYQDENVFVINKPVGMVVHPAAGNTSGTLAQGIKYLLNKERTDFSPTDTRPGIVHRLDKDTSGIIIVAKNTNALELLSSQFRNRTVSKTYLAIIKGKLPKKKGTIETLISRDKKNRKKMTWQTKTGKKAISEYRVLSEFKNESLVALNLKTGRTHQLRVHMLSMKTPIVGDTIYSRSKSNEGLMLHAYKLRIKLPGKDEISEFCAPIPERFKSYLCNLEENN